MQNQIIGSKPGFKELKAVLFQITHQLKHIEQKREKIKKEWEKRPILEVATVEQ